MRGWLISCLGAALLVGCTQPQSSQSAIGTNVPLSSAGNLAGAAPPGTRVWRAPDIAQYPARGYYIPPVTVDRGQGAGFSGVDPEQVASILTQDVRRAVGRVAPVVSAPGPGTHTLQLVLVRAEAPHPEYLSNGPYPWAAAVVGMPSRPYTSGEMVVAGKATVSSSGKLLAAFVVPVTPNDMMMGEAPGPQESMDFVQDASRTFADSLAASIARQLQLNREAGQS